MLDENSIDFLIVCVPTKFHIQETKKALKYKKIKLVLCEKPFGFKYKTSKKKIIQDFKIKKGSFN